VLLSFLEMILHLIGLKLVCHPAELHITPSPDEHFKSNLDQLLVDLLVLTRQSYI